MPVTDDTGAIKTAKWASGFCLFHFKTYVEYKHDKPGNDKLAYCQLLEK